MRESHGQPSVGIVGVGALGLAVAERLLSAGFSITGFRRSSLAALFDIGGRPASSAADVVTTSDIVILLLPSDAALDDVMIEICPALRAKQIVLCLGTHEIGAKRAAFERAREVGAIVIDGEVSGTPAMLRNGQASVMVAGDRDAIEAVRPVLAAFAKATNDLGAFGNASKMKLVTNYLVGVHTLAAAEALLLADHLDLDLPTVVETIAGSAGGSVMMAVRGRSMVARAFEGGPMSGFLRFFDLLREALPEMTAGDAPILDLTEALYRRAIDDGCGDKDIAAISDSISSRWRRASAERRERRSPWPSH